MDYYTGYSIDQFANKRADYQEPSILPCEWGNRLTNWEKVSV
jgi:hypothetical protein